MQYEVVIEGFIGRQLTVEVDSIFAKPTLLIDGETAVKGKKWDEYLLLRNDGREVTAKLERRYLEQVPNLVIDGEVIKFVEPLHWYQWVWAGWPLVLLLGGMIGAAIGATAATFNVRMFRSDRSPASQYLLSGLISATAVIAYILIATLLRSFL